MMGATTPQETDFGYLVTCPGCGQVHELVFVTDTMLILNGDENDEFRIHEGKIVPDWICRNLQCAVSVQLLVDR